jgi:VanZ family protein
MHIYAYNVWMRRHGWLIFWILAIIFPTAAIGRFSLLFQESFNKIFNPIWMHILMHLVLFAGLSALLMLTFRLSLSARTMAVTLCVVFGVGLLQEGFQAFNQGYFSLGGSISDVAVDMAGGLLGLLLMGWKSRNPVRTGRLDN